MNRKTKQSKNTEEVLRPVDRHFAELNKYFVNGNKWLYALFLSLAFFGVMGLIWMIPFPQFQFLVNNNMHTFLNWGSFFIAIVIYTYLKLAPTLSYAILFVISIMSFFIVQLEYVEKDGGPTVILVCSLIAFIGFVGLIALCKKEQNINGREFAKLMIYGPIWLWSKLFKHFKLKY